MAKSKIDEKTSLIIQGLLETEDFTYQDILNHFEDKYTLNQIKYHIKKHYPNLKHKIKKEYSRGGSKVLFLLKQIFPLKYIHEEYQIKNLRLDFFIDHPFNLAIEFDGEQHYSHNNFFYKSQADFKLAQERDKFKETECKKKNIKLIRLKTHKELTKQVLLKKIKEQIPLDQLFLDMKIVKRSKKKKEKNVPKNIIPKKNWKELYQKQKLFKKQQEQEEPEHIKQFKKEQKEKQKLYRKQQYQKLKKQRQQWNNKK